MAATGGHALHYARRLQTLGGVLDRRWLLPRMLLRVAQAYLDRVAINLRTAVSFHL
jgi:hypothetical protein